MTRERPWPPIPKTAYSVLGPMPVDVGSLDKEKDMGAVDFASRSVQIAGEMVPAATWGTYWHECIHIALYDAGVAELLPKESEETICNAIALYLTAAMRAGHIKVIP